MLLVLLVLLVLLLVLLVLLLVLVEERGEAARSFVSGGTVLFIYQGTHMHTLNAK